MGYINFFLCLIIKLMNKIDVSLLICCHYGTSYDDFKKTFISILNQQDAPNEIIIIKNGHLDEKLDDYLNEIKFSYQTNLIQLKKYWIS